MSHHSGNYGGQYRSKLRAGDLTKLAGFVVLMIGAAIWMIGG